MTIKEVILGSSLLGPIFDEARMERIRALNSLDLFLPREFILGTVLPGIATTVVCLTLFYHVAYAYSKSYSPKDASVSTRKRIAYQMTNMAMNSVLGLSGLYVELFVHPRPMSPIETLGGCRNIVFFGYAQIGYNLWAVPMGLFFVKEPPAMIVHHFAVMTVSFLFAFFTNGFRGVSSFFLGLVEISSVPLSLVNTFKQNPEWIAAYPDLYTKVRFTFAFSFLVTRVFMFVPRLFYILIDGFIIGLPSDSNIFYFFLWLNLSCCLFLLALQLYWGYLIIRNMANHFAQNKQEEDPHVHTLRKKQN